MKNLAADPMHAGTLLKLRDAINQWIKDTDDQGAIDEGKTVDLKALKEGKWNDYAPVRLFVDGCLTVTHFINLSKPEP